MTSFCFPFAADQRGNKLERFLVRDYSEASDVLLLLCGPDEVASQIVAAARGACQAKALSPTGKQNWTHAFYFSRGVPSSVSDLCNDLTTWLTIPARPDIDISLSLDWYKQPCDDGGLADTRAGQLIAFTKYATYPQASGSRKARIELVNALAEVISNHPVFADAELVSSPPGSKGDGTSFGEQLGRDVAKKAARKFVPMNGPAREPQKELIARHVRDDFELSEVVDRPIVLIDDVFHTGVTLESAARAARRAGAPTVLALTAARTLRR
ncbi:phosphoribosyltransferase [Dermatophilaceae bacterium Sec6.4]